MNSNLAAIQPNPDVIIQRMDDALVLLHLRTNRFYRMNATGARFWELLSAGQSVPDIQQQLLAEFDVTPAQLAAEIDRLLAGLRAADLVRIDE